MNDRFEMRGEIGAGGMGVVYRVHDRDRERDVALKVLRRRSGVDLFRFKREFRALADLRHPNLVELYELFSVQGDWMFTMELIDGVPFRDWVRPGGVLDEVRLRDALGQVADALATIHAVGKIHRDVKPTNILVDGAGRAVVLDFGLITGADELVATPTHDGAAVGTPLYMSPEQACDEPLSAASDVYSLGVMLYEALAGQRPHEGPGLQVMERKVVADAPPLDGFGPMPADLEALAMRMLSRAPRSRPSAADVRDALGRAPVPAAPRIAAAFDRAALAALHDAVAASRQRATFVLVVGPAGAGKSALLEAARADLVATDAVVLSGRATVREELEYRAGDQIIDQLSTWLLGRPYDELAALLPPNLAALAREFPVLQRLPTGRATLLPGMLRSPEEIRRQAGAALVELTTRITAARPLVLLVDDGEHATQAGTALARAFDWPHAPGILLVIAHSSDRTGTLALQLFDDWQGERRRIELTPPG